MAQPISPTLTKVNDEQAFLEVLAVETTSGSDSVGQAELKHIDDLLVFIRIA